MAKSTTPEASELLDGALPTDPSVEDIECQADRMKIIADSQLSPETINRFSVDDLEQRRLRALGR